MVLRYRSTSGTLQDLIFKTMKKTENLIEALFKEMNRVRELIVEYKSLPGGVGNIGAALMQIDITNTERAITEGDIIKELQCYEKLKNCE
jgi:hypothetical protein